MLGAAMVMRRQLMLVMMVPLCSLCFVGLIVVLRGAFAGIGLVKRARVDAFSTRRRVRQARRSFFLGFEVGTHFGLRLRERLAQASPGHVAPWGIMNSVAVALKKKWWRSYLANRLSTGVHAYAEHGVVVKIDVGELQAERCTAFGRNFVSDVYLIKYMISWTPCGKIVVDLKRPQPTNQLPGQRHVITIFLLKYRCAGDTWQEKYAVKNASTYTRILVGRMMVNAMAPSRAE